MTVIQFGPRSAKPGGSPKGDEPGSLPQATALGVTSIHPERRLCVCGAATDGQDIHGDPLCDECAKWCTYCADCDDEVAHEYFTGTGVVLFAEHHHCRPKGFHRKITACVCTEPCRSPICTCETAS